MEGLAKMSHELNRLTWREWRFLPVALKDDEVRARGEHLADTIYRRRALEAEQAAEKKAMKEDLDSLDNEIVALAVAVNDRREIRSVEIEVRANLTLGMAEEVRMDTGEITVTRPLDEKDKMRAQSGLPFDEPKGQD